MTTEIMEILAGIIIATTFVGGGFTLLIMKMRYRHLEDKRVSGGAQQEGEHLADSVDNLRAEFELLRNEFLELNERVDFTERLLERPKTEE